LLNYNYKAHAQVIHLNLVIVRFKCDSAPVSSL